LSIIGKRKQIVIVDGSVGEGGGQILRISLANSGSYTTPSDSRAIQIFAILHSNFRLGFFRALLKMLITVHRRFRKPRKQTRQIRTIPNRAEFI